MFYFVKTPGWLMRFYKKCVWSMPGVDKIIYLTFDDGPHPGITPFVLDELKKYNAKATFFCVGQNVANYPEIYKRIIDEGHATGNHTYSHLNGWHVSDHEYLANIEKASNYISSTLYRPPYGRIRLSQIKEIQNARSNTQIIMWSVLSGDFDKGISPERCLENVISTSGPGSIVVFHDSEKAIDRMRYALSGTLKYFGDKGFRFSKISQQ